MIETVCPIISLQSVAPNIYLLAFRSDEIARSVKPGQFVNIRVTDGWYPLLRRPFSVYRTEENLVEIIFNVIGQGTKILAAKRAGDMLDVLGPLGSPFHLDDQYETALLVGGGLGVAPLPILAAALTKAGKPIRTYLGARTKDQIVQSHLTNVRTATDDGTEGFRGTVVDLLRRDLDHDRLLAPKVFGCGPNAMLKSVAKLADEAGIPCEVSLESTMACGIGICQGCPVERKTDPLTYALICKEGPVFSTNAIRLP